MKKGDEENGEEGFNFPDPIQIMEHETDHHTHWDESIESQVDKEGGSPKNKTLSTSNEL